MPVKCGNPTCTNEGKHLCANCAETSYCGKECQVAAWPSHKGDCKRAHKPEAASLQQSFKDLSVAQLQNILKLRMASPDVSEKKRKDVLAQMETALEKPTLLKLVQDHVDPVEIDDLLSKPTKGSSSSGSGTKGSSSSSNRGNRQREQVKVDNTKMPTRDQLLDQARRFRQDPDLARRHIPEMKNMTDAQILEQAAIMEQVRFNYRSRDPPGMS